MVVVVVFGDIDRLHGSLWPPGTRLESRSSDESAVGVETGETSEEPTEADSGPELFPPA